LWLRPGEPLPSTPRLQATRATAASSSDAGAAAGTGDARVDAPVLHATRAAAARSGDAHADAGLGEGTGQSKRKRDQDEEQIDGKVTKNKTLRVTEAEGVESETTRAAPSPGDTRAAAPTSGNAHVNAPRLHDIRAAAAARSVDAHVDAELGEAPRQLQDEQPMQHRKMAFSTENTGVGTDG
jgi:hypothetical protein